MKLVVKDYLYTNEFNKRTAGSSGLAIIKAANHYGVKYTALKSKKQLQDSLKDGKVVFAAMGNGKFGTTSWNHAIILYKYSNNSAYALDPLVTYKNGWVSIDNLWREQSKDPDDSTGGSNFYSLEL